MKKLKLTLLFLIIIGSAVGLSNVQKVTNLITQLGEVTSSYTYFDHSDQDTCYGTTVDSSGNYYCAGATWGSLGEENGGSSDAFVMKVNPEGQILWTRQLGATTKIVDEEDYNEDHDACLSVAVDSSGNVYCAGRTGGELGEIHGGGDDAFVMKLDPNGIIVWLRQFGETTVVPGGDTSEDDTCNGVSVDSSGNVYCAGYTSGAMGEGNGDDKGIGDDAMVMKLDPNGNLLWIRQLGITTAVPGGDTSKDDECYGVALDSFGNPHCAGYTEGDLGDLNAGGRDVFAMKLDTSGNILWVAQIGASSTEFRGDGEQASNKDDDVCYGVTVDSNGNVFCAGATEGPLGELKGGLGDAFVAKFTNAGALSWVTQLGASTAFLKYPDHSDEDRCLSAAVDSSGNVYCGGATSGSIGETNAGQEDAFAIKLDTNGVLLSAKQLGLESNQFRGDNEEGSNQDQDKCYGIAIDNAGNAHCAGGTTGSLGEENAGSEDAFVMKFQFCEDCLPEPEPDPCDASPTGEGCEEPEPDPCEASPTAPECEEPDPVDCEASPTDPACQPDDCRGDINDQGLCVPTKECIELEFLDSSKLCCEDNPLVEACCNADYDVDSPGICYLSCAEEANRAINEWCCDGTVDPRPVQCPTPEPVCDGTVDPLPAECCDGTVDPRPELCPEPEPDPCDASPTAEGCEEPDPEECPGTIDDAGLCTPPVDCNLLTGNSADLEECCAYDWDVSSPEVCIVHCAEPADREATEWCCDGTVDPMDPNCPGAPSGNGNWPTEECLIAKPGYDYDYCCGTNWDNPSPEQCYFKCNDAEGREENAWCCAGNMDPTPQGCTAEVSLTQKEFNSMMKTLGLKR